jgi:hypothetical protein
VKIYRDDIIVAMELRAWGAEWKQIGRAFGCHHESLRRAVQRAERGGYAATTVRGTDWGTADTGGPQGGFEQGSSAFAWDGRDVLAACLGVAQGAIG